MSLQMGCCLQPAGDTPWDLLHHAEPRSIWRVLSVARTQASMGQRPSATIGAPAVAAYLTCLSSVMHRRRAWK